VRRALLPLVLALAACAATDLPPRLVPGALDEDELRIWRVADEADAFIARTGKLYPDAALEAYLLEVARRLQPPEAFAAIPFRFRVVKDSRPGAFCLPNGAVYLHTGLLARLESEAELAAVLGHEMAHATHRHVLRQQRRRTNWGAGGSGLLRLASVTGYARELEWEADREGFERVRSAGYDPADAVTMLERLREFAVAEDLKEGNPKYALHPRIEERIDNYRQLLGPGLAGGSARNADAYVRRTASVLLENGRVEAAAGRYRAGWDQAQRFLRIEPAHAGGHLLLGEIARRDATAGSEDAALASYRRALELDPGAAEAWRGLGLVHRKKGDRAAARAAFARYLELAPDAPDRALVRAALEEGP
jgi:predicted Zn-dependent protease